MTTPLNTTTRNGTRGYLDQDGTFYVGVTGLIRSTLADPAQLARWKQKRLVQHTIDILGDTRDAFDDDYVINEALNRQFQSGPEAELGTKVHSAIENYERDQVAVDDLKLAGYLKQWINLKTEHDLEVLVTEITLVNTQLGYAGTADSIVRTNLMPFRQDRFVLDVKTGKGVYDTYALQLALLAHCDAWLAADGSVRKLPNTANTQYGIVAKLGPRSGHLHRIDLRPAWKVASILPRIYHWNNGQGLATISESLPGKTKRAANRADEERRAEILDRARALDMRTKLIIEKAWQPSWPSLKEASDYWTDDALDDVEILIANAERGGVA